MSKASVAPPPQPRSRPDVLWQIEDSACRVAGKLRALSGLTSELEYGDDRDRRAWIVAVLDEALEALAVEADRVYALSRSPVQQSELRAHDSPKNGGGA
jgi:hypothetical protein